MIEAIARQLLTTYGFPEDGWRQFTSHHDNTGTFLINQRAHFTYVAAAGDLRRLATFLNPGHTTGFARGLLLINLNQIAGRNSLDVPAANALLQNPVVAGLMAQVLVNWTPPDRLLLVNFIQARVRASLAQLPANTVATVLPLANLAGVPRFDLLHVLDRVTQTGDGCTNNVRDNNIRTLIRVDKAFPQRFTGFTRWGPGDALDNSPVTNLSNHFRKHVCNSTGQYPVDAKWWWRALQIQVRVNDIENPAATQDEQKFFRHDGTLDPAGIADFIDQVVRARPALLEKLRLAYEAQYRDYAIKLSRELSGVLVEASADEVMIGGYTGHVTIFGRYDDKNDANSELGISSCYFVETAKRGAKITLDKPNKLWELH